MSHHLSGGLLVQPTGSPHPLSGDSGDCPQQGGHRAPEPSLPSDPTCRWAWTGQLHPGPQQQPARGWALEDPTQWPPAQGLPGQMLGAPPRRHQQQEHPAWGLTGTGGGTAGMAVRRCTRQVHHATSRSTATPSSLGLVCPARLTRLRWSSSVWVEGELGARPGSRGQLCPPPQASGQQCSQLLAQQQAHLVLSCWGLGPGLGGRRPHPQSLSGWPVG